MLIHRYRDYLAGPRWLEILTQVMGALKHECVSIVSLPFGGRRFMLRCIEQEYIRSYPHDSQVVRIHMGKDPKADSFQAHLITELQLGKAYEGQTSLSVVLKQLRRQDRRFLFIIDMFENAARNYEVLNFLEEIRAIDPRNIRFLLGVGVDLLTQPENYQTNGSLVTNNIFVLPAYTLQETRQNVQTNSELFNWESDNLDITSVHSMSGGNPGLVKYICKIALKNRKVSLEPEILAGHPALKLKLLEMAEILRNSGLVSEIGPNPKHGLLTRELMLTNDQGEYVSQLVDYFLNANKVPDVSGRLTVQEEKLYQLLTNRKGEVFPLDEIAEHIWGEAQQVKYSLWGLYKLISNTNKKLIDIDLQIRNSKSRGYYLTDVYER